MMLGKARIRRLMPDINGGLTIIADNTRYPREKSTHRMRAVSA